jgi:hypothetical protein
LWIKFLRSDWQRGFLGDEVMRRLFKVSKERLGGLSFSLVKILGNHCGGFGR